jgi:hypothetical protein
LPTPAQAKNPNVSMLHRKQRHSTKKKKRKKEEKAESP